MIQSQNSKTLKIGNINLDAPFFQAPLSGYSDYAMRKLAVMQGAPLTFAGVMLAKSAANPKVLRKPIFAPKDDEHPVGAQILGSEPQMMAKAAKGLTDAGYDLIGLNFACPAGKVLRRGRGGYLLNEPDRAIEIFQRVRDAVSCPVTIKLRISYGKGQNSQDNFWEIVTAVSNEGVDALTIHGRSVLQRFRDKADWNILAKIKQELPLTTIIGSGDLFDAQMTADILKETGIDGVVIARGAIGNPWIFRELRAIFEGKDIPAKPTIAEQGKMILKHFELVSQIYKPVKAVRYLRKFLVNYCKLHPERKKTQQCLLTASNKTELLGAIKKWYKVGRV